ncbi:MAG TPA: DUF5937 family protein [Streptosporangiaceae bacterium]
MAVSIRVPPEGGRALTTGTSPLAELMTFLHARAVPEHHVPQGRWIQEMDRSLRPPLRAELDALAPLWSRYRCRLLFPLAAPLDQPLDAELAVVQALPLERFCTLAARAIRGVTVTGMTGVLADPVERAAFLAAAARRSAARGELARSLVAGPEAFRARLVAALRAFGEQYFATQWARLGRPLAWVSEQVRYQLAGQPAEDVLTRLDPAATWVEASRQVVFGKLMNARIDLRAQPCLLLPSLRTAPHLTVKHDPEYPAVIQFPVQEWQREDGVSLTLTRERFAVLADVNRLDLCRHLAGEPISTSDLANRMGLREQQVSRHLARMREVRLVRSERRGRMVYHRLADDVIMRLGLDYLSGIVH